MKFFNRNIGTIYAKELKDILRDRRTLFVAIILPIIINPLLIIGLLVLFSSQTEKEMQKSFTAVIIGEEHAPELTKIIREFDPNPFKIAQNDKSQDSEGENNSKIVKLVKIEGKNRTEIMEQAIKRLESEGEDRIDIIIRFPDKFEERLKAHDTPQEPKLIFLGTSDRSTTAKRHISNILRGFVKEFEPIILKSTNIRQGSVAIKEVAKIIPYILILMILTAAFTPAIDLMAGEKERGTIETLLITPADRREIVLGKFYTVFTVAISATILNLASLGVTVSLAKNILQSSMRAQVKVVETQKDKEKLVENSAKSDEKPDKAKKVTLQTVAKTEKTQSQPPNADDKADQDQQKQMQQAIATQVQFPTMPFILFPVLLLMMIPAAALFGAIALALSSFAKSYKEG
ncbi:MAG: ABC transporter permease subunit, partial [Planctomycetes bacterium]|nr:ABC transporter permease subunit [Planctomycetota bacterium]